VVKADGLAAGKGVFPCRTLDEALEAVDRIMVERAFGEAGQKVVIEEFLEGEEASFLAITDGEAVVPFPSSQDHKAVFDGDTGPNTGGMGAYSPAPVVTHELHDQVMERIMIPTVRAMAREGTPYRGILYAGLMIRGQEAKVLEFNVRFGDPEAQPLVVRLRSDLVPLLEAARAGTLKEAHVEWDSDAAVCVVMASQGYPGPYQKGVPIEGLEEAQRMENVVVFHAGTAVQGGRIVTAGGRVLGVTAKGRGIGEAVERVYKAVGKIRWDGVHYRRDIGKKALDRLGGWSG
jgi:phosphoribosylamine--glycine ligase